jgi:hypothetical protein
MNLKQLILPALAVGTTFFIATPEQSEGYSLIGGSLNLGQRDFRIFNNFTDNAANNNQVAHPSFPGYQGADMSIWKASVEWSSIAHGDGSGDGLASNGIIGNGGANFDPSFQGNTNGTGGTNNNIHSEISGSSGGVLAYTETPISDGWRIRYFSGWSWHDGPNGVSGIDLQGVACHEYGHALGLGHSTVSGATMRASITGTGQAQRSINNDDSAGVQAVYGVMASTKPVITSIAAGPSAGTVEITGSNFTTTNNDVWFTQATAGGNGTPIKVTGATSTSGGTQIVVTLPANAGPGDILVKRSGTGHNKLSNAYPIDTANLGNPPTGLTITSITPGTVNAVVVDNSVVVSIFGSGFLATTGVKVDGQSLSIFPAEFQTLSDNRIDIVTWPLVGQLGPVNVTVVAGAASVTSQITVIENSPPAIELVGSSPAFLFNATGINFTVGAGPGDVAFVFLSGSNLPSNLPGLLSLGIGNNFSNLFQLTTLSIGASGHAGLSLSVSGVPTSTTIYMQTAVWDVSAGVLPLVSSNVQTGTFLF